MVTLVYYALAFVAFVAVAAVAEGIYNLLTK